jgi:hypothetical protein
MRAACARACRRHISKASRAIAVSANANHCNGLCSISVERRQAGMQEAIGVAQIEAPHQPFRVERVITRPEARAMSRLSDPV